MSSRHHVAALFAAAVLCAGTASAQGLSKKFKWPAPQPVPAPTVPAPSPSYPKGPDPTAASLEQAGPFATQVTELPPRDGFAGGRVWYPAATDAGKYGVVALSPGYTGTASQLYSWGERIASHGFVAVVIDSLTPVDSPEARAQQLAAALDPLYLVGKCFSGAVCSPLHARIDTSRRAFLGHSMGGGGALVGGLNDPSLRAVVALAPWHGSPAIFNGLTVPTLSVGCQADPAAPVAQHAAAFYEAIPVSGRKAYVEVRNGDHLCVLGTGGHMPTVGNFTIAWLKRFVDNDARYSPFLCGAPYEQAVGSAEISAARNTCPF